MSERKRREEKPQRKCCSYLIEAQPITVLHYECGETNVPFASIKKGKQGSERRLTKCHLRRVFLQAHGVLPKEGVD